MNMIASSTSIDTITTAPGAAIGNESDALPAKVAQLPGQHEDESAPTTTAQRVIATFRDHGINWSILVQLQHIQELALAIQLQGNHLIHLELFGLASGEMVVSIAGGKREDRWRVGSHYVARHRIEIPPGGDEMARRDVQGQLAHAAADLMELLEEDAQ